MMPKEITILVLGPDADDPSCIDQSLGASLSAANSPLGSALALQQERFDRDDLADLDRNLGRWQGKVSAVIGATNVLESTRLGQLAEQMSLLCFVANNNPVVWQGRRHVFHIGLPTSQTTSKVASLIQQTGRRRVLLLHDDTEFQARVASSMEAVLKAKGMEPRSHVTAPQREVQIDGWPELIYVIFSNEPKAFVIARAITRQTKDVPVLFGRSLLRESFLTQLHDLDRQFWFVDMFHRNGLGTEREHQFRQVMAANGIMVPTANHAFGWDGMTYCALALEAARNDPAAAIEYLESGINLEGASGSCSFTAENHNGRSGSGPTTFTRWYHGQLDEV
jgi:ABC-type branched-subunit amino acid transport system substrate-binding protein